MNYREINREKRYKRQFFIIKKDHSIKSVIIQSIITLCSWGIVFYCFYDNIYTLYLAFNGYYVDLDLAKEILYNLLIYSIITLGIVGSWICYNKKMFGGKDRRKHYKSWNKEQIMSLYDVNEASLDLLQNNKTLSITFDEHNKIKLIKKV